VDGTSMTLEGGDLQFLARGDKEIFGGWREVIGTDAAEERSDGKGEEEGRAAGPLSPLATGTSLTVLSSEVVAVTTRPRPLFTQASLVADLKRRGIGRPSTYPSVVPLVIERGWVVEQAGGKDAAKKTRPSRPPALIATDVGFDLVDFLLEAFPSLLDYGFTADLERALDEIDRGQRRRPEVGSGWWARFSAELGKAKALPARRRARPDLGLCPRCEPAGRAGRLRLIKGVSKEGRAYEFAGCDCDQKDTKVCGYTAPVVGGKAAFQEDCPECGTPLDLVRKKNGGHAGVCKEHGWFLADRKWRLVKAPRCRTCGQEMTHRENSQTKGQFFWGCFADKVFIDSDLFGGRVESVRRKTAAKSSPA
jgi:ssDNA-binding Zn-finger/Zn-ribbon topoisomerase 1